MSLKYGIQMYSVRNEFAADPIKAIRKVSAIGYKYIELANLHAENDCGCGIFSTHMEPLDANNIDKVLEYYQELGTKFIVSKQCNSTIEDVMKSCENYNFLGEKCRQVGIQHMLHLGQTGYCEDGEWALDKVAKNTTPENLMFEVDTYWMLRSGFNPCNIIQKYKERVAVIHQKDLPVNFNGTVNINSLLNLGEQVVHSNIETYVHKEDFCEIGRGQMDVEKIVKTTLKSTAADYIVLEQDHSAMGEYESIKHSYEYMSKLLGKNKNLARR